MTFENVVASMNDTVVGHLADRSVTFAGNDIRVLWDRPFDELDRVAVRNPRFSGKLADFPGIKQGDAVTVDGQSYTAHRIESGDNGWMQVSLRRA